MSSGDFFQNNATYKGEEYVRWNFVNVSLITVTVTAWAVETIFAQYVTDWKDHLIHFPFTVIIPEIMMWC